MSSIISSYQSSSLPTCGPPMPPPGPPPPPPPPPPIPPASSITQSMSCQPSSRPRSRLRQLPWTTIPASKVNGRRCFWTEVCGKHGGGSMSAPSTPQFRRRNAKGLSDNDDDRIPEMNFEQMERLFAIDAQRSGRQEPANNCEMMDRKKHSEEINLLDAKRSLTVNIFLRQFHSTTTSSQYQQPSPADQVVRQLLLKHSDALTPVPDASPVSALDDPSADSSSTMQVDTLRSLLKIFPDDDELKLLRSYQGDRNRLGQAERFLVELTELTECKLRIECVLVKAEFMTTINCIRPVIDAVISTVRDIKENEMLHSIIYIILIVGNYLNAGGYSGEAVGFRIGSLLKLTEIRANKPNMNLLHYVAMIFELNRKKTSRKQSLFDENLQAEAKDPELLQLPQQFAYIKEAAQYSSETTHSDISLLSGKIDSLSQQIQRTSDDQLKRQFTGFIEAANDELRDLERDLAHIESLRRHLADYFCEDETTFKLDDCITTFSVFLDSFRKAVEENEQRRLQAEKAEERRRQREQQLSARQSATSSRSDAIGVGSRDDTVRRRHSIDVTTSLDAANEDLVRFLRHSQRLASVNGDSFQATEDTDVVDLAGTGSLSRRRSLRRSRRLTPEVMHSEREWTGSPGTTLSTTPSPRPFTTSGSPMLVTSNMDQWTMNGGSRMAGVTKRLLPVHPDFDAAATTSRRCHSSMSTFVENRYFVPISTGVYQSAGSTEDEKKAALPPRHASDQRRARSSMSSRRLPSIADSVFQSGAETNVAPVTAGKTTSPINQESSAGLSDEQNCPVTPPRRPRSHEAIIEEKDIFRNRNVDQNLPLSTEHVPAEGGSEPNSSCCVSDFKVNSTMHFIECDRTNSQLTDRPLDSNVTSAAAPIEPEVSDFMMTTSSSVKRSDTLKNRFRRLSMFYQNDEVDEQRFATSLPPPSVTHLETSSLNDCILSSSCSSNSIDNHRPAINKNDQGIFNHTVTSDDVRAVYEDTDSTSSGGRDEGFESETPFVGDVPRFCTSTGEISPKDDERLCSTLKDSATASVQKNSIANAPPGNRGSVSSRRIQMVDEKKPRTHSLFNTPAERMTSLVGPDVTTRLSRSTAMKSPSHTVKTATSHLSTASRPQLSKTTAAARPSTQFQKATQRTTASITVPTSSVQPRPSQPTTFQRNTTTRSTLPMASLRQRSRSVAVTHRASIDEDIASSARQGGTLTRRPVDLNRKENASRLTDESMPGYRPVSASTLSRPSTATNVDRHRPTSSTARVSSTPVRCVQTVSRRDAHPEQAPVARTGGSTTVTPKSGVNSTRKNSVSLVSATQAAADGAVVRRGSRAATQQLDVDAASVVDGTVAPSPRKSSVFDRLADPLQSQYRKQNSVRK